MAAEPRRLAQLPGYDTAPDVYETPDPHDEAAATSTIITTPGTSGPSQLRDLGSDTDDSDVSHEDDDQGDDTFGVSRRRLYPARARSRFGEASRGVETSGADLSDRVDGRRKGYRVRRRKGAGATASGDGGDGEEESLQMRIARLRREVEECRIAAEKSAGEEQGATGGSEGVEADAKALNQLLARIDAPSVRGGGLLNRRALQPAGVDGTAGKSDNDKAGLDVPSSQPAAAEESLTEEQSLSRIAAFDTRLASLEAALGLSALDSTGAVAGYASGSGPVPILPALTLLDSQFATLSSASSLASLEAASAKIAALKHEARNLAALQQAQTVPVSGGGGGRTGLTATNHSGEDSAAASEYGDAEEAPSQHDIDGNEADTNGTSDAQPHLHASDLTTLRALYTHLPTLQALMPTLPALLTRLRSLRALHTTAGQAAADLEALERRQDQLDAELATWRAGLERVEAAVREADQANGRNGTVVKGWVEGLEKRVEALTDGAKTG